MLIVDRSAPCVKLVPTLGASHKMPFYKFHENVGLPKKCQGF